MLQFALLETTYFYHTITRTSEVVSSKPCLYFHGMDMCLSDFVMILREKGRETSSDFVMQCQQN